ncbi:MAG: ATP-binding protein [Suipraeoptans sp.]
MRGGIEMKSKINIRPTSGVYATYKRLSYQPWTAIAEFVDNSTQSYYDHKKELHNLSGFSKLTINIDYEARAKGNDVLTITDNAFGMEIDDFERAIILDRPPKSTVGRNEFGMGLKTAACWFGSKWTVTSTQYGSSRGYSAFVDVDKLERDKDEEIDLTTFNTNTDEHYTRITIERLNKKITGGRTVGKVRDLLSSIYREDLRTGKIVITYNGNELSFKDPVIYEETLPGGKIKKWKQDISFTVHHEGKDLPVSGYIALRLPGSVREAGLTLMRRGRVIVGGPEANYRPVEIFGDSNSYTYQRLFGELHMDEWPVTQAKDEFDWHSSGLEELFIEKLIPFTKPLRTKADTIRVRQRIESVDVIDKTFGAFQKSGLISSATVIAIPQEGVESVKEESENKANYYNDETTGEALEFITDKDKEPGVDISGPDTFQATFDYEGANYHFTVKFDSSSPLNPWVTVKEENEPHFQITINMKHAFFKPFTENKEFMSVMAKLVMAMILAEIGSLAVSSDGRINPGDIRMKMNGILEQIVSKGGL